MSRILLMPVVAGISYELIRLAARTTNPIVKAAFRPGLWLQYLTTREPHDDQIEVAIRAMNEAKPVEEGVQVTITPCDAPNTNKENE